MRWLYNLSEEDEGDVIEEEVDITKWNGIGVSEGKVVRIDWYDEDLTGVIPDFISKLNGLTYLFLGDNDISGDIPVSLGRLVNLRQLNLCRNRITGSVPKSFKMLRKLEEMGLYNNDMESGTPGYLGGDGLRVYLKGLGGGRNEGEGRFERRKYGNWRNRSKDVN